MNLLCLQSILNSKPEGDCHVNNLRRRGQSLCDHADTDEGRKVHAQKAVRDAEEQWRTVLLAAKHVEAAAEAEISQRTESRELEVRTVQRKGSVMPTCALPTCISTQYSSTLYEYFTII